MYLVTAWSYKSSYLGVKHPPDSIINNYTAPGLFIQQICGILEVVKIRVN